MFGDKIDATIYLIENGANTTQHINHTNGFAFTRAIELNKKKLIKLFFKYGIKTELVKDTIKKEYKKEYHNKLINRIDIYDLKYIHNFFKHKI
jgi:hypothetical protein